MKKSITIIVILYHGTINEVVLNELAESGTLLQALAQVCFGAIYLQVLRRPQTQMG